MLSIISIARLHFLLLQYSGECFMRSDELQCKLQDLKEMCREFSELEGTDLYTLSAIRNLATEVTYHYKRSQFDQRESVF